MRPPGVGAPLDRTLRTIDDGEGRVAVFDFTLPPDLRERVPPGLEVGQERARQPILDLHPRPAAFADCVATFVARSDRADQSTPGRRVAG